MRERDRALETGVGERRNGRKEGGSEREICIAKMRIDLLSTASPSVLPLSLSLTLFRRSSVYIELNFHYIYLCLDLSLSLSLALPLLPTFLSLLYLSSPSCSAQSLPLSTSVNL